MKYGDIQIKQHSKVKYLRCLMDEAMTLNVIHNINNKLTFCLAQNCFLIPRRLLCNALIQTDFDYTCSANLTNKLKHRIQTTKNKCTRFCLQLDKLEQIYHEEIEHLNKLSVTYKFK